MKFVIISIVLVFVLLSCNPFAPGLDNSSGENASILGDRTTIDGLFKNFQYAYSFRDTIIYGQLVGGEFTFLYRDYDRGVDVSWGRDEEMRITNGLFQNVQRLDLVWNNIVSSSFNTDSTEATISRNFNLTVMFNPSNIIRVDGYAGLVLERQRAQDPWMIVRWRDESNF